MKLQSKITNKNLDAILSGEKKQEFLQIESIKLIAEDGRIVKFKVPAADGISPLGMDFLRKRYPEIDWKDDLPGIMIAIGDIIHENSK